jgi:hypothetical protein
VNNDHTPAIGALGAATSFALADASAVLAFLSALVSLVYVGTKWTFLILDRRARRSNDENS